MARTSSKHRTGWVAGINHGAHDASCVLAHEGRTVVWVEQDRLSRIKHAANQSPADALAACLKFAGIALCDLDAIALGSDHEQLIRWLGDDPERAQEIRSYSSRDWLFPERLFGHLDELPPLEAYGHHTSHAASAFYSSGFGEAAALVMDAMGENTSTMIGRCSEGAIQTVKSYPVEESLGYFYETAAEYAGFSRNQAGKLMGLAAYGSSKYEMPIRPPREEDNRIWTTNYINGENGRTRMAARCDDLASEFAKKAFPYLVGMTGEPMAYRDFAASAQAALEQTVIGLAKAACEIVASRQLVLAGGVALNCAANGKLADSGFFDRIFVQPASNDSGVALGAAIQASFGQYGAACRPSIMRHAYWGLSDEKATIRRVLDTSGLRYSEVSDDELIAEVAQTLRNGGTVAWHQGRAEIGPRALGARSLLGDPRSRSTVVALNRIKGREVWRPLAPSVCDEDFATYFNGTPNPFMIVAAKVKSEVMPLVPAIVHFDGTARPQTVEQSTNPRYHRLIKALGSLTGVPVVVNTSLNGPDEPICCRAEDTIAFFQRSSITLLAIENFVVRNPILRAQAAAAPANLG